MGNFKIQLHYLLFFDNEKAQVVQNSATRKMRTSLSYIVNTIVADDLALQGTRSSATLVMSSFPRDILASAQEGLTSFSNSLVTYCKTQQKSMKTGPPTLHYKSLCHLDLREQLAAWLKWYIMHQESKPYSTSNTYISRVPVRTVSDTNHANVKPIDR